MIEKCEACAGTGKTEEKCPVCDGEGEVEWGEAVTGRVNLTERSAIFSIAFNHDEVPLITMHADMDGLLITEWLRRVILAKAQLPAVKINGL